MRLVLSPEPKIVNDSLCTPVASSCTPETDEVPSYVFNPVNTKLALLITALPPVVAMDKPLMLQVAVLIDAPPKLNVFPVPALASLKLAVVNAKLVTAPIPDSSVVSPDTFPPLV